MSDSHTYPPIGDHALIGDGRSMALVDRQATITWMALPEDDRIGLFASILDAERGGCWTLAPTARSEVSRSYRADSAVLCTTFRTETGTATVTDAFTLHNGAVLPWVELARRVTCDEGRVELAWTLETPGFLGADPMVFEEHHDLIVARAEQLGVAVSVFGAATCDELGSVLRGRVTLDGTDQTALLALALCIDEPVVHPDRDEIEARIDRTIEVWRTWSEGIGAPGRWADQLRVSARTLKLLTNHRTGAPIAAPTTSLPERIGGGRNYDYRYCWIRDASFMVDALLSVDLVEEAHRAINALLEMCETTRPSLAPLYTIGGKVPTEMADLDLHGYRGSKPVHRGNDASDQLQLGTWGDLFDAIWRYVDRGNQLDPATAGLLTDLADELCNKWTSEDAGIWELPDTAHYTVSKLGAWTALDRAQRLVDLGELDGDTHRWAAARAAIRDFVEERCWSPTKRSFTFHAETDELDAACLLAGRMGFASAEQLEGTVAAVRAELTDGPFVWRYSGMREKESAFLACSFWLADALTRIGRLDEARQQIDGALGAMNDLGLMSEEYDPMAEELLGNFPQGLSHLSFVNAAVTWEQFSGD